MNVYHQMNFLFICLFFVLCLSVLEDSEHTEKADSLLFIFMFLCLVYLTRNHAAFKKRHFVFWETVMQHLLCERPMKTGALSLRNFWDPESHLMLT